MLTTVPDMQWERLSALVAEKTGLHFPRERWNDLQRGVAGAALELRYADEAACVGSLLGAPPTASQIEVLASHLTIGETYFFRDQPALEALARNVLPELIRERRGRAQRLRIWSAACCSGEEPYSLAILLHRILPDLADWQVTITATDINPRFLQKAARGVYGEWSFRGAPAGLKQRYFTRTAEGRYAIVPEIRKLVTFAQLNLVEERQPALAAEAIDVIFCRNVLMYFTPAHTRQVIANLDRRLAEGGWLAVSPVEASQALFHRFETVNFSGVTFYRKSAKDSLPGPSAAARSWAAAGPVAPDAWQERVDAPPEWPLPPPAQEPAAAAEPAAAGAVAQSLYQQGRYAEAAATLEAAFTEHPADPAAFPLLARALANAGSLVDALAWCERWIAADKVDPAAHYLRAVVLLEQGDAAPARASLQRALYLDPGFVLAHFSLGNLSRRRGESGDADRHFGNALRLLQRYRPDDVLPESDGLTAGRLADTLATMPGLQRAP